MLDLASHFGEGPVILKQISQREEISEKYLWQLINPLKSVGLVRAMRGAHGGYVLAKTPSEITVKDILQVVEGSLCIVECVEKPSTCSRSTFCVARDLWGEASKALSEKLEETTLADLLERKKIKQQKQGVNYEI
jgi:Rrf2 family protein